VAKAKSAPKPSLDRPRSWDETDRLLHLLAETEQEVAVAKAEAGERIHAVSEALAERLAPSKDLIGALQERIETFAIAHKKDFDGARSLALAHGRVGWRATPPAVRFLRPVEEIVATLEERKLDVAILVTKRPSKDVLATFEEALLDELGVRITQRDEFFVETAEAPASAAP